MPRLHFVAEFIYGPLALEVRKGATSKLPQFTIPKFPLEVFDILKVQ